MECSPPKAARTLIEQPYAWEYKFLAYVLKGEFDNLRKSRWDFKYGFFEEQTYSKTPEELLLDISEKLEEIQKITEFINVLINHTMHDAIGAPGVPSDLEMIIYFSKQFSALYQRLVAWGLHFKSLHTDAIFDTLLALLYKFPSSILMQIDDFVNNLYQEIINIPDIDDHSKRSIHLECILDASNTEEINAEIENITRLLQLKL